MSTVSVCIATYRRPLRLGRLLRDLQRQTLSIHEVIVIDNDARGSARTAAERAAKEARSYPVHYEIVPQKSIAEARNRAVSLASGAWIALIDDDERAPREWLERLREAQQRYSADAVLGPVQPVLPASAPRWIGRGAFYDWPRRQTGTEVPLNQLRLGNALVRRDRLLAEQPIFDPNFGLTGGEDGDLLIRLVLAGARIIWCDEAIVLEPVSRERLSARWLMRRAFRGGQNYAQHLLAGRYGPPTRFRRISFAVRSAGQLPLAILIAAGACPGGIHAAFRWLLRAAANAGRLWALAGGRWEEYR